MAAFPKQGEGHKPRTERNGIVTRVNRQLFGDVPSLSFFRHETQELYRVARLLLSLLAPEFGDVCLVCAVKSVDLAFLVSL
jgi:hypothetical protein